MDTTTLEVVVRVPSARLSFWITDTVALVARCHCEGCGLVSLNVETGDMEPLGGDGVPYWSPDETAFITVATPYVGLYSHVWAYDMQTLSLIRPGREVGSLREDSPCWTPDSSHVLYTRQVLTYTAHYTVTVGPRQVMMLDRQGGGERVLLGDADYDYFIGAYVWEEYAWSCTWRGDWLPVSAVTHTAVTTAGEPHGKQFAPLWCPLYGRYCADGESLALNWRTGEVLPGEEAPIPTVTSFPTPEPTATPGPDMAAMPVYSDPGGTFALFAGPDGTGLWRVPAEGKPAVLFRDGRYFTYIP
jgi:hypothetical protein